MSVHEDRLLAEYSNMLNFRSQVVSWEVISGNPPDIYRFKYHLKSIIGFNNKIPRFHTGFVVEADFPEDFPRNPPTVRFVKQPFAFHPNVLRNGYIAWRNFKPWIPGIAVSVDWLCQIIGEMIAFQVYELNSLANSDTTLANWVRNNKHIPVDLASVRLPNAIDAIQWAASEGDARHKFIVGQENRSLKGLVSKSLHNLIIKNDITGKIIPVEEVPKRISVRELISALENKIGLPVGVDMVLVRGITRQRLPPHESLEATGIKDGEVLLADYKTTSGFVQVPFTPMLDTVHRLRNLTIVNTANMERHHVDSVPSDITIQELLSAFADRINLPDGAKGVLIRKATHNKLMLTQTLQTVGIANSEELLADFETITPTLFGLIGKLLDTQLHPLKLTKDLIYDQGFRELKESLERIEDAIRNPQQFGTVKLKVDTEGNVLLAESISDSNYELGILPILLERKKLIVERLKAFSGDEQMGKSKIKILFLAANPTDTSHLRLDEEIRSIDEALLKSEFRGRFNIEQHWAVRVKDLQSCLLRHRPDIVHFSGHGSRFSQIVLENTIGESHAISVRAIEQLFTILKDNVRCVILNACYSEEQAVAIANHIDCVIGMSKAIGDKAAISFSTAFYQALGYGRDIKTAFDLGCLQIDLENLKEQDTPKLLTIKSNPSYIRLIQGD